MTVKKICIASTSKPLGGYVQKRLEELGAKENILLAHDNETLNNCLDCLQELNRRLTRRDMAVIGLICEEMDNETIAVTLTVKEQTIKNRRRGIYTKLNVTNTVGLIKCLFRRGVISVSDFLAS